MFISAWNENYEYYIWVGNTHHTSQMTQVQTTEPTQRQEASPQSYPPLIASTHIIHTHTQTMTVT